jgi:hypothetical protein
VAAVTLAGSGASGTPLISTAPPPQLGDGPAPCSSGNPPFALAGWCGTYSGANTFYGTYGPGFPTPFGWGLCADPPASGGWYPSPSYGYVLADPPSGASGAFLDAVGFGMSEGTLDNFWGQNLAWGPNEAAVAAKLYYDALVWNDPLPTLPQPVADALASLYTQTAEAIGATGDPQLSASLPGGATSFTGSTTVQVRLAFPGSGRGLAGIPVSFSLTNALFDANHQATISAVTGADGSIELPITATSSSSTTVTMTSSAQVGHLGTAFFRPTASFALNAQDLASPLPGITVTSTNTWTSNAPPPALGTVSILKTGNDEPYLSIAGATFDVLAGATVVDVLTTDASGRTPTSAPLPVGSYTIHEAQAPPGYQLVPDKTAVISANTNTVVTFTGASGDLATPASLTLKKVEDHTGAPLAGATFELERDPTDTGSWVEVGTCTTDVTGTCVPPGGTILLPGYYRVIETAAPPGFLVNPPDATQYVELAPGETTTVTFADDRILTHLFVAKQNAAEPGEGVPNATYDLFVVGTPPESAPPVAPLGVTWFQGLHFYAEGTTDEGGHLGFTIPVGYRWCVSERSAPEDFVLDPALRCTGIINAGAPDPVRTVAIAEVPNMVTLSAYKFNAADPGQVVPGATYALFVEGAFPDGFTPPRVPSSVVVPQGDELYAIGTTDDEGQLHFQVPSGSAWCLQELAVPSGYQLDPGLHCTAVLTSDAAPLASVVPLPEIALLAATGAPLELLVALALSALGVGAVLVGWRRRRA